VQLVPGWKHDLAVVGDPGHALGRLEPIQALADDPHRFTHLVHVHAVAVVDVATAVHGDAELDLVVREVRLIAPEVPVDPGRAQHRPRLREGERVVGG
jgi:hypothetical protein